MLPYSRMATAPGNSVIQEPTEMLAGRPRAPRRRCRSTCPTRDGVAGARHGGPGRGVQGQRPAGGEDGLARQAGGRAGARAEQPGLGGRPERQALAEALAESEEASRALGAADLDDRALMAVERVRLVCSGGPTTGVFSPLERSDREEALTDWLLDHGLDDALAGAAGRDQRHPRACSTSWRPRSTGDRLRACGLRWVASGCMVRSLTQDIERAASRVHELVSAVKGFTYMDHAPSAEPVDVAKGSPTRWP